MKGIATSFRQFVMVPGKVESAHFEMTISEKTTLVTCCRATRRCQKWSASSAWVPSPFLRGWPAFLPHEGSSNCFSGLIDQFPLFLGHTWPVL